MHKIFLFVSFLIFSVPSFAFKLNPISETFAPKGKNSSKAFKVHNPSKKKVSLEIYAQTRAIDIKNIETRVDTQDFVVFPPQMILEAGQERTIRVNYVGDTKLDHEKAYRLIVKQLPVNLEVDKGGKPKTGIEFIFEYVASLYVRPANSKPKLRLISKSIKGNDIILVVKNEGSSHSLLSQYSLELKDKDSIVKVDWQKPPFKKVAGYNLLPGNQREVIIRRPKSISKDGFTASLKN